MPRIFGFSQSLVFSDNLPVFGNAKKRDAGWRQRRGCRPQCLAASEAVGNDRKNQENYFRLNLIGYPQDCLDFNISFAIIALIA